MKVVILAGGLGTRLAEETVLRPKPMVEIGGKPMLWHIMSIYASYGFTEFIVALGYKGDYIKDYFLRFHSLNNDLTVELATGATTVHREVPTDWRVHLVDTGPMTQTGGRIRRLRKWIGDEEFMFTYGDGLSNVNIKALVDFHRSHGKLCTVTAVRPPSRFGEIDCNGDCVVGFNEKPQTGEGWINGGFFVARPDVLDRISGDDMPWEAEPMESLANDGELMVYKHSGFWLPMDTFREKQILEGLWNSPNPPWKVWE